jgi:hypothetical protein
VEPFTAYQDVSLRLQSAPFRVHPVHCVLPRIILLGVREGVQALLSSREMEHKPPHARPSAHVVGPEEVRLILIFSAKMWKMLQVEPCS